MMPRGWRDSLPFQMALGALLLSVGTLAWTTARAVRVDAIPNPPPATIASLENIRRGDTRPKSDIESTVDNNVFSIDRSAPAASYRMPGEPDPNARPVAQPEKPQLLGTAVATDGRHFATVQMRNDSPMLVHVGDKVGEWTVRSIERGKLVVTTASGVRAELTVSR